MSIIPTKRGDHAGDIQLRKIVCIEWLSLAVVLAVGMVYVTLGNRLGNNDVERSNARIEEFNALPLEDRRAIIEWNGYEDYDQDTFLRFYQETHHWYYPIPEVSEWKPLVVVAIILVTWSVILSMAYGEAKISDYRFYDLPRSRYGLVLFLLMFASWPVMLVSLLLGVISGYCRDARNEQAAKESWERYKKARAEQEGNK